MKKALSILLAAGVSADLIRLSGHTKSAGFNCLRNGRGQRCGRRNVPANLRRHAGADGCLTLADDIGIEKTFYRINKQ